MCFGTQLRAGGDNTNSAFCCWTDICSNTMHVRGTLSARFYVSGNRGIAAVIARDGPCQLQSSCRMIQEYVFYHIRTCGSGGGRGCWPARVCAPAPPFLGNPTCPLLPPPSSLPFPSAPATSTYWTLCRFLASHSCGAATSATRLSRLAAVAASSLAAALAAAASIAFAFCLAAAAASFAFSFCVAPRV